MNGILVINKEQNYTSRDVVNILNKKLKTKKIGHTGTLDPLATGVLVVCIGKYTKLVNEITSYDKEYVAEIKLGIKTNTGDITGNIIEKKEYQINEEQIINVFNSFVGKSIQTVPKYSAIKVNGKKLYEYARNNIEVELPKRQIEIYNIELINYQEDIIKFKVKVSKGTYIRSLIEDICFKLNTVGTMKSLIRTKQGNFNIENSYTLKDIEDGNYKFVDIINFLDYPTYELNDELLKKVLNGSKVSLNIDFDKVLLKYNEEIIAIYVKENDIYKPHIMLKTN
jgi:tRNA pseudouridine55 synthase